MSDAGAIQLDLVAAYLPALARVGGIMATAPLFASSVVPRRVRAMLAVALTLGLMPAIAGTAEARTPATIGATVVAVAGEAMVGVAMGLAFNLVFVAAQWAGGIIAEQMGLSLAESFDPVSGSQANPLAGAFSLLTLVVFLGINGHHALIRAIGASFQSLPVGRAMEGTAVVDMLVRLLTAATTLALQLAAPVIVTLLLCDVALGMIGRTVPQVGLMTAGVTVRAGAALIVLVLLAGVITGLLQNQSINWMQTVRAALPALLGK
jgi:flagellar biosynthetic protein FliR